MDTNFNLNLLLVLILAILYCFRDSDYKADNFENYLIDNFQETVESEEETSDLNKRFNELEKKYKNKPTPKNNKIDEYLELLCSLLFRYMINKFLLDERVHDLLLDYF